MRLPSLHFLSMKALSGKVFCNSTSKRIGNISTHFPEEQNKTQKLRWPSKVPLVDPVELRFNHLRGTLRAQLSSAAPPVQAMPGEAGDVGPRIAVTLLSFLPAEFSPICSAPLPSGLPGTSGGFGVSSQKLVELSPWVWGTRWGKLTTRGFVHGVVLHHVANGDRLCTRGGQWPCPTL